jgi:adenylosuccinate synthase
MAVTIVLGGQWGDEGKGKVIDALAADADMVVRANGGADAGHTVVTDNGTFKFHLIPSGILHPSCACLIGAGVVVDPETLFKELDQLQERGVDTSNLRVSSRCHLIMPYHPVLDKLEELRRGEDRIGTTQRGMGPCYADKAARRGIRIADIIDPEHLRRRLEPILAEKNEILDAVYSHAPYDLNEIAEQFASFGERIGPYVANTESLVQDAIEGQKSILLEGAQAVMLDIDYGSYPFVTSSSPTAAGVCQGAGVGPTQVDRIVAVYKAYTTRVGSGAFPTELHNEIGEHLRERGAEFGTTTGRPRRTGWFDAVLARYSARLNGVSEIALTKFDILDQLEEISICVGYTLDGEEVAIPPANIDEYARVVPIYETMPGWLSDTSALESMDALPENARSYLARIEELVGARVRFVGVGPHRRQIFESDFAA